ncbi:hypothetical protein [Acetobacter syzygii]|uniref:hypothetical protein n=1 Tax=Acetobacter syzygii TaxID=146476 RepID=UPI0006625FF0|nr:hypothetical protein [Acetobacter syzygii]NSL91426.1 hypothetical protein [Acetobacter syzygii]
MADSASDGMVTGGSTAQAPCGRKRRGLTRIVNARVPSLWRIEDYMGVCWPYDQHKNPHKPAQSASRPGPEPNLPAK